MGGFSTITGDQFGSVMNADNASFDGTSRGGVLSTDGQLWIGSSTGRRVRLGSLTAGAGVSIVNGPGTITIANTGSMIDLHVAKWIVNAAGTSAGGNQTTIAAAITAASNGDTIFIMPGTYTENLTLKAGVNLAAFVGDGDTPTVTISGNCTFSSAGTVSISGIRLQTNSAAFLTMAGSAATIVNLNNCYLNCLNNTGISFTTANASASLNIFNSKGDLGTTGIAIYSMSSTGALGITNSSFSNTGASTTASTNSAGSVFLRYCIFSSPGSVTSTGLASLQYCFIDTLTQNVTGFTFSGGASSSSFYTSYRTGSASAISVTTNGLIIAGGDISSTNTNAITGAGTINYVGVTFSNTSSKNNVTTQAGSNIGAGGISFDGGTNTLSNYTEGTFTPTVVGQSVTGATTYTTQTGYYRRIGNLVIAQANIAISAATGTGNWLLGALPFTIKNQATSRPDGTMGLTGTGTWPASVTCLGCSGISNGTSANITGYASGLGEQNVQASNNATNFFYTLPYEI